MQTVRRLHRALFSFERIIFKFCSLVNLGMYIINMLFHGYFACMIFIHSLCKTNSLAALVRLFYTTCE